MAAEKENPYEDVDLKRKSFGRKPGLLEGGRSWSTIEKSSSPPQVSPSALTLVATRGALSSAWTAVPLSVSLRAASGTRPALGGSRAHDCKHHFSRAIRQDYQRTSDVSVCAAANVRPGFPQDK